MTSALSSSSFPPFSISLLYQPIFLSFYLPTISTYHSPSHLPPIFHLSSSSLFPSYSSRCTQLPSLGDNSNSLIKPYPTHPSLFILPRHPSSIILYPSLAIPTSSLVLPHLFLSSLNAYCLQAHKDWWHNSSNSGTVKFVIKACKVTQI